MDRIHEKYEALSAWLRGRGRVAVAFSSGVDSTFLLACAKKVLGDDLLAVTARLHSMPKREYEETDAFCRANGIRQITVDVDELTIPGFAENPPDRCYHCKTALFTKMKDAAAQAGFSCLAEGSNLDDLGDYRPGLKALEELEIASPLREVGLTKQEIRDLSKEMGLPTWEKPSFACLSSRFAYGEMITAEKLAMVEQGEDVLRTFGFRQFRVRMHGADLARIEVLPEEMERLFAEREDIGRSFKEIGFLYTTMDLQGFRTGSMNEALGKTRTDKDGHTEEDKSET